MDVKDKADSLSDRMNKLTENFALSEEMTTTGEEVEEYIQEKTHQIELYRNNVPQVEVINLGILVDDFTYIRDTLKESTENGRRILNVLTVDLLDKDIEDEKRAEMITSFAELNLAVCNNMKLYILSYEKISVALLNVDKYNKQNIDGDSDKKGKTVNNNTINITTANLLKLMKEKNES